MRIIIILVIFLLCGCATQRKALQIQVGMSRAEVIDIMGHPDGRSGDIQKEILIYRIPLASEKLFVDGSAHDRFEITIEDDKVTNYKQIPWANEKIILQTE